MSHSLVNGLATGHWTKLPMRNMAYENTVHRREEIHNQIFYAARHMNDSDV
jgi:hypothetical protein